MVQIPQQIPQMNFDKAQQWSESHFRWLPHITDEGRLFAKLWSKQRAVATSRNQQYKTGRALSQSFVCCVTPYPPTHPSIFCTCLSAACRSLYVTPHLCFNISDILVSISSICIYNVRRREISLNEKVYPHVCPVVSVNMLFSDPVSPCCCNIPLRQLKQKLLNR